MEKSEEAGTEEAGTEEANKVDEETKENGIGNEAEQQMEVEAS